MAFITPNANDPTQAVVQGVEKPALPQAVQTMTATAAQPGGMVQPTAATPAAQGQVAQPRSATIAIDDIEDESVTSRLAAITASDNPVMRRARSSGMRAANARGLLNSSIAVGAAEDAVYKIAAPLAAQEAGQAATRNNSRLQIAGQLKQIATQAGFDKEARADQFGYDTKLNDQKFGQQKILNAEQYAQEMARLEKQLASADSLQAREIAARKDMLTIEFQNQSKLSTQNFGQQSALQAQQIGAQMEQLNKQIASAEGQQKLALQAEADRLKSAQLFNTEMAKMQQGYAVDNAKLQASLQSALQSQGNTEQMQRMAVEFANQQAITTQQGQQALAQIAANGDQEMRRQALVISASMEELTLKLNQQNTEAAAQAAMNLFAAEANIRAALLGNQTIPAAERQAYMNAVSAMTAPTREYVNRLLGVTGTPTPTTPAPGGMAPAGIAPSNGTIASTGPAMPGVDYPTWQEYQRTGGMAR